MSGRGGGRNKGKFGKHGGKSGGKSYIANVEELEKREGENKDDSDEESEEESEEESGEEGGGGGQGTQQSSESVFQFRPKAERDAMKQQAVQQSGEGGGKVGAVKSKPNVNHAKAGSSGIKVKDLNDDTEILDETAGMNRKEREVIEAARAKEAYMKKHLAGETEQARKDMERLALVKARRAQEAAKRALTGRKPGMSANGLDNDDGDSSDEEPEKELTEAAAARKAAATATVDETPTEPSELEILKAIDIKKMNGDALKEALKARGLSTQGSKKDLMSRLTDHEKSRA